MILGAVKNQEFIYVFEINENESKFYYFKKLEKFNGFLNDKECVVISNFEIFVENENLDIYFEENFDKNYFLY